MIEIFYLNSINFKELDSQTPLRIRFQRPVQSSPDALVTGFKKLKEEKKEQYRIKIIDRHVWIALSHAEKKYYSPTLHLEFEAAEDAHQTNVRGLFGPEPSLWTLFMFLHFVVAGIFIMFMTFAYSDWTMEQPVALDVFMMVLMVVAWFLLYFFARLNRQRGLPQARAMEKMVNSVLDKQAS